MSRKQVVNPPAFPRPASMDDGGFAVFPQDGMTLRDWFAGQAIVGLLARSAGAGIGPNALAKVSGQIADAMLEESQQ